MLHRTCSVNTQPPHSVCNHSGCHIQCHTRCYYRKGLVLQTPICITLWIRCPMHNKHVYDVAILNKIVPYLVHMSEHAWRLCSTTNSLVSIVFQVRFNLKLLMVSHGITHLPSTHSILNLLRSSYPSLSTFIVQSKEKILNLSLIYVQQLLDT